MRRRTHLGNPERRQSSRFGGVLDPLCPRWGWWGTLCATAIDFAGIMIYSDTLIYCDITLVLSGKLR
jgi:hypothetical protein